jgi:hypothetical protein
MTDETKPLSDDERKELDELRASQKKNDEKVAAEKEAENAPLPDTHWLNLADGRTVVTKGVASHYEGVPVLHATEIPAELQDGGNTETEPVHRF